MNWKNWQNCKEFFFRPLLFRSKPIEPHLQLGFISMCIFFFTLHLFFLFDVTLLGHDVDDLGVVLLVLHPPPLPNPTTVTSSCGGGGARPPPRPLYQHLSENRKAVCGRRVDSAQLCKNSRSPEFGQEVLLSPAKPTQNISFPKKNLTFTRRRILNFLSRLFKA